MPYALHYAEELEPAIERELREFTDYLRGVWYREHNEDGTHNFGVNGHSGESSKGMLAINENAQSYLNTLNPGFIQSLQVAMESGSMDSEFATVVQNLIDLGEVNGEEMLETTLTLTEAQIESLNSSPIVIIPSPGAAYRIYIHFVTMTLVVTTAYSTNPTFTIRLVGRTGNLVSFASTLNATGTKQIRGNGTTPVYSGAPAPEGDALQLMLSADPGTPGTGVASGTITVHYTIEDGTSTL
jgi:hypothetical protein